MDYSEHDDEWEYDDSRHDFPYLKGTRGEYANVFISIGCGISMLASIGDPSLVWLPIALALPLVGSFIVGRLPRDDRE